MKDTKKYYAFFDVDGTLLKIKSILSFLEFFYRKKYGVFGSIKYKVYLWMTYCYEYLGLNRNWLNRRYYKKFRGCREKDINNLGSEWYQEIMNKEIFNQPCIEELEQHQRSGAQIVLVSGSFQPCLNPIANKLGVNKILAVQPEVKDGFYTGAILPPQTIGKGKSEAIQNLLMLDKNMNAQDCFAYGDHISDVDMLEIVGHPRVIGGDAQLEKHALIKGWTVIHNTQA